MGGFVAEETQDPAAYAADIDAGRERMIAFVASWTAPRSRPHWPRKGPAAPEPPRVPRGRAVTGMSS